MANNVFNLNVDGADIPSLKHKIGELEFVSFEDPTTGLGLTYPIERIELVDLPDGTWEYTLWYDTDAAI